MRFKPERQNVYFTYLVLRILNRAVSTDDTPPAGDNDGDERAVSQPMDRKDIPTIDNHLNGRAIRLDYGRRKWE